MKQILPLITFLLIVGCASDNDDQGPRVLDPIVNAFDVTNQMTSEVLSKSWCSELGENQFEVFNFESDKSLTAKINRKRLRSFPNLQWSIDSKNRDSEISIMNTSKNTDFARVDVEYTSIGKIEITGLNVTLLNKDIERSIPLRPCYAGSKLGLLHSAPDTYTPKIAFSEIYNEGKVWNRLNCREYNVDARGYIFNLDGSFYRKRNAGDETPRKKGSFAILENGEIISLKGFFKVKIEDTKRSVVCLALGTRFMNQIFLSTCNPVDPSKFLVEGANNTVLCPYTEIK